MGRFFGGKEVSQVVAIMDCVDLIYINDLHPKPGRFRESGWRLTEEKKQSLAVIALERWLDRMRIIVLRILLRKARR